MPSLPKYLLCTGLTYTDCILTRAELEAYLLTYLTTIV